MTISNRQGQRRNSTYHEHFKSLSHTLLASMRLGKRRYLEREEGKKRIEIEEKGVEEGCGDKGEKKSQK